ncbi:GNAT family N-acetyltransferase [Sphingomonas baiyangensis]|uniref:GNAT family N-acetyltransferase n=1 Tax=Sphingomonas baiyangensis TaxID=2572576 RepID=A0A4U1L3H8_9SPHN|nr:GNAT family N-acetyltransferase [Sphingomonas baiyangensis]TKD51034.1 GNAT family N-acetyltransferase [Sphingomonas baiyangensis]
MTTPVRAQLHDDPADPAIAPAWDALASAAGTANPFYGRDTLIAAMHLPGAAKPRLLLLWGAGGQLDGLLPVARRPLIRGAAHATENWDQRARALGEPLIRPGREAMVWRAALAALDRSGGLHLRLSALDAHSASTAALREVAAGLGRPVYETRRYERAILVGGGSSEEHCAQHIRGKVLKEHRRLRARLADQAPLMFERLAPDGDVDCWTSDLFALEATGWKGREGVDAGADPATEAAYRAILARAHEAGSLDFHRMMLGDRVVAMLANLEIGDTGFQLKIAYDEAFASYSPGVLLEMEYLRYALDQRRLALVDSCARAGHPMIDRIWPARRTIVSLAVPFVSPLSRGFCAAADRWRRRAKAVS